MREEVGEVGADFSADDWLREFYAECPFGTRRLVNARYDLMRLRVDMALERLTQPALIEQELRDIDDQRKCMWRGCSPRIR